MEGTQGQTAPGTQPPPAQPQWQPWTPPPPYNPIAELVGTVKSILWSTGFISFIIMLFFSFVIVLAMTPEIQQWITTAIPSANDPSLLVLPKEYIFIITPWPMLLFSIDGSTFQAWHFVILGLLISAFAYANHDLIKRWMSSGGAALKNLLIPEKATSSLEGVAKLFMASISFSMMYFIFLSMISVEMQTPDFESMPRPELIYGLFSASVFEELISRVLLVGVPLVIAGMVLGWKKPASKILGGGLGLTPLTFSLIMFSAVMFAFAHVGSWDFWKVPQVLVTGLALGWAFTRYGLHASILIHFSINLSSSALDIWPNNDFLIMALGMAMLIWMVAGGYFFLHYGIELTMRFAPKKMVAQAYNQPSQWMQQQAQNPPPHMQQPNGPPPPPNWPYLQATVPPPPWAYGQPPATHPQYQAPNQPAQPPPQPPPRPVPASQGGISGGFVCPNCGHTGANYDSGKLICLRCGSAHFKEKPPEKAEEKKQIEF